MASRNFKPMIRPTHDQPVDIDLFIEIYDAINSLNSSEVSYIIDNASEPWSQPKTERETNRAASESGLGLKVVAGIFSASDSINSKTIGKRTWDIAFPSGSSFSAPPIVTCTAVYAGGQAEPVGTCIQSVSNRGFRVHMQSVSSTDLSISHINYIAMGV